MKPKEGSAAEEATETAAAEKTEDAGKKPYGDVLYADPGYQADGQSRYPIDTKEHVKAALSYIGKQANRDKYPADKLKLVEDRINAAAKRFGISTSPDEADTAANFVAASKHTNAA